MTTTADLQSGTPLLESSSPEVVSVEPVVAGSAAPESAPVEAAGSDGLATAAAPAMVKVTVHWMGCPSALSTRQETRKSSTPAFCGHGEVTVVPLTTGGAQWHGPRRALRHHLQAGLGDLLVEDQRHLGR